MPKNLTPAMRAHLDLETTRLAAIWRITRKDGQQFFFTDHDRDIVFSRFERTAIRSDAGFAVDNLDLVGVFAEGGIVEDEVRAGLVDGAEIRVSFVNWADPDGHGEIRLRRGTLGETRLTPQGYFHAELRGLAQPLAQSTLKMYSPVCRADLGNAACTFPIWPDEVARNTAYALGEFVGASDPPGGPLAQDYDDSIYECVVAGTTRHAPLNRHRRGHLPMGSVGCSLGPDDRLQVLDLTLIGVPIRWECSGRRWMRVRDVAVRRPADRPRRPAVVIAAP
jgi:hypothetical protein